MNRKWVQHDNAPAHTSNVSHGELTELEAFEVMAHSAYSPDLARSAYHLL